jgi:1-acyl-sn-glycerol-3-phosphate acyltransferase
LNTHTETRTSSHWHHKLYQVRCYLYHQMIRILGLPYLVLWYLVGWRIEQGIPDIEKYVVLAAPHTSNWDLLIMLPAALQNGRFPRILMKHTLFRGPLGWVLDMIGAIPIDRTQPHNIIPALVAEVEQSKNIILVFTPEGTRKKTDHWKSGFYYVALGAKVPIICEYVDYKRKRVGAGLILYPSGDIASDFAQIRTFYENNGCGKHPDQLSDIVLKPSHGQL